MNFHLYNIRKIYKFLVDNTYEFSKSKTDFYYSFQMSLQSQSFLAFLCTAVFLFATAFAIVPNDLPCLFNMQTFA